MRKPLILVSCLLLLASLSCQLLVPEKLPQTTDAPDTAAQATIPVVQPEPTQSMPTQTPPVPTEPVATATQPPAPTKVVVLEDMILMFWNARVSYDPALWQPGDDEYPRSLGHVEIPTCIIYEQGPTEPPPVDREITLGSVTYKIAELESQGNPVHWYMAVSGPQGPFADGIPTLAITSDADQFEECLNSAEKVLSTMR